MEHRDDAQRREQALRFAEAIDQYQQNHRALMEALRDDAVSLEAFEAMSARLLEEVNALKQLRQAMSPRQGITRHLR